MPSYIACQNSWAAFHLSARKRAIHSRSSGSRTPSRLKFLLTFIIWILGFSLSACASTPRPTPALSRTPAPLPASTPTPVQTPAPFDTGWLPFSSGLDRREVGVPFTSLGFEERLILFRIDPAYFDMRVLYSPGFPRRVSEWGAEAGARLAFNAAFFDEKDVATGLVVSDGKVFGKSYQDFGGMFAVDEQGASSIRSLAAQPYQPDEPLRQAVQGFPMLIYPDGSAFANEDATRARRTALGQDAAGRVYLVVAPHNAFTLAELAAWLHDSDLGLTTALNLDGGGSTGYWAGPSDVVDSFTPVPAVVAVYVR
jgi:phosphodiester glycosidase